MPKRDLNALAAHIVKQATDETPPEVDAKDQQTRVSGRRGGLKGGKARAEALSPERRSEIARVARRVAASRKVGPRGCSPRLCRSSSKRRGLASGGSPGTDRSC